MIKYPYLLPFTIRGSVSQWLEHHSLPCFWRELLGIPCPGCGMQTSLLQLMKGNILECIKIYPALMPILLLGIFSFFHLVFGVRNGHKIIIILAIISSSIMIINYLLHIVPTL